jgi:predicted lipoprotein with Yx(FWY)xxD motif
VLLIRRSQAVAEYTKEKDMKKLARGGMIAAFAGLVACQTMGDAPVKFSDGVMVDSAGMTLYTYTKDGVGTGKSACNGKCAVNWPPLKAAANASSSGDFTIITRDDGSKQWAYQGKPLYLWIKDKKPGDRTGDGWNKVWYVIKQ